MYIYIPQYVGYGYVMLRSIRLKPCKTQPKLANGLAYYYSPIMKTFSVDAMSVVLYAAHRP